MKTKLIELIDFEKVNTLLEGFNKTTGFVTAILDFDGNVLSKSGWRQICTEFHRINPETSKKCTISDTELAGQLARGEKYHFYKCLNGLVDVAVPVVINGEHIANLFSGQFFFEEPDLKFFKKQAEKYGFDEKNYMEALGRVPVVSKEKVIVAMDFLLNMTQLISETIFQKLEQTESNKALKEREEEYRNLIEISPVAMSIIHDWKTIYFNPAAVQLFGAKTQNELLGKHIFELIHPDFHELAKENAKLLAEKGYVNMQEQKYIKLDGSILDVETQAKSIQFNDDAATLVVINDITERKKAEEALRHNQERFRIAQDMSPDGFTILRPVRDTTGQITDFTWVYENPAVAGMNGTNPEEVAGKRLLELFPGHRGTPLLKAYKRVAESGESCIFEADYSGETITKPTSFRIVVVPMGEDIAILAQDITERKQVEEALKNRENLLNKVFDVLPIGLWFADENGRLIRGNPAGVQIWGAEPSVSMEEYGVFKARSLPSGKEIETDDWALVQTIREGVTIEDELLEIDTFDGQKKIILNYTAPVIDDHGKIQGAIVVNQDVTERKQAEEILQKSEENLRITLRSIGDAVISTDINGLIVNMNPIAEELCGWGLDEAAGNPFTEVFKIINAETREIVADPVKKVLENGEIIGLTNHTLLISKNGNEYQIAESAAPIKNKEGKISGVVLVIRDQSEERKLQNVILEREKSISRQNELFSILLKNLQIGVFMVEAPSGKPIIANDAACHLLGRGILPDANKYNLGEVYKAYKYGSNEPYSPEEMPILLGMNGESAHIDDMVIERPDGSRILIEISGTPIVDMEGNVWASLVNFIDITERKQSEEALRKSEENLRITLRSIGDAVISTDINGLIVNMNPIAEELCGWGLDEAAGKPLTEVFKIINDITRETVADPVKKVLEKGEIVGLANHTLLISKNGNEYQISDSAAPIKNIEGKITGVVLVFSDISEKYAAQKKIKESEERFQLAMNASNDGLFDWNLETNDIYYAPSWKKMLGYEDHEVPNDFSVWENTTDPEDVKKSWELQQKLITKQIDQFVLEFKMKHKRGHWVDILSRAKAIFDDNGKAVRIVGTHTDITERKQAEEALRESEVQFRNLANSGSALIWTSGLDKLCNYFNDPWLKFTGRTIEQEIGNGWAEGVHPDDFDRCLETYVTAFDKREPFEMEYRLLHVSGEYKVILDIGTPNFNSKGEFVGYIGHCFDITERKHSEEALRESEARFRTIFEIASLGIAQVDPSNGKIILVNAYYETITGYRIDELLKMTFLELTHPEDREKDWKIFSEAARGEVEYRNEKRYVKKDGTIVWVRIHLAFIRDEKGKPIRTVAICEDITERKRAEKALRESEEKMHSIYNVAPTGMGVVADRVMREVNPRICEMTGYTREELIDKNSRMLYPTQEEYDLVGREKYDQIREKGTGKVETHWQKKDGTIINIMMASAPIDKNDYSKGITFTALDITERKQAEMIKQMQYNIANAVITLKNLNELFDSIKIELNNVIDARNIFIALYNEGTGMLNTIFDKDEKVEIPEWPAKKSLTGYVIEQNRPVLLRKEEIRQLHREGIIELIGATAEVWLGVPLKIEGKVLGAIVVQNYYNPDVYDQTSIEILELVAHELSIFIDWQRSEEKATKLSRAVEQSSVTVMITNREGDIEYVNPFFTEQTGYSTKEVIGKNPKFLKSGYHPKPFYETLWSTILSGNNWDGEMLNKKKNRDLYWEKAVISPIVNNKGIITNFVAIKEDITERKKMIEELVTAKEKAEESDRLKSAFLANMSHEIRTPMNGILGFAELLKEPNLKGDEQQKYIGIIEKSGARMLNIINDIVDISKIESGLMKVKNSEINVNMYLDQILTFFNPEAQTKNIKLNCKAGLPKEEAFLKTDSEKFHSILINLVKNALKFTETGYIEFGYKRVAETQSIAYLQFYVKDTGVGIPKDRQEAIFERFVQADIVDKMARQGAGLGLSITRAYVEMMGGKIWVESEEGIGSTFYFTLPCFTDPNEKATVKNGVPVIAEGNMVGSLKILIAEDDETSAQLISIHIRKFGKEIINAQNGREALEACRNNPDIDLILMDIQMPEMNGYEATRQIRQFNTDVIIIALTAFALTGDREKAIEAGCNDYIAKPINKTELMGLIQKYAD